ncbi:MAG: hypothetical protein CSA50_02535 [Gammaproteobacteria bacterium]|nr:MAG: hypothetical protein CSA50_02535 [Gammaproteobacteria bacterium]
MNSRLLALSVFTATALTISQYPAAKPSADKISPVMASPSIQNTKPTAQQAMTRAKIEVVFVLDTTGSMSGMIQAAKEKIWAIASSMANADPAPDIKMGLIAFRDRGDQYVTRTTDLSTDLDSIYAHLMGFQADGGGDAPESVNQALHEAIEGIKWSNDQNSYKVVFLVGDAPAHMDYQDDIPFAKTLAIANIKGILVNTIQCGDAIETRRHWNQIARLGGGDYFNVAQNGGALPTATPYDADIAKLSDKLDNTRIFYGTAEKRQKLAAKVETSDRLYKIATSAALARRAEYNATESGRKNFLADSELVDDVATGRVKLEEIDQALLPDEIRAMTPEKQRAVILAKAKERKELQAQLATLGERRRRYLEAQVTTTPDASSSLDIQLFDTIKKQAQTKGLNYQDSDRRY